MPLEARKGPLIVNETTGLPYLATTYTALWRKVRTAAGLPSTLWNRDIRAGAITEGGEAGASSDDRGKLAGHVDGKMARSVYDRDTLEGANRVAEARAAFRQRKQSKAKPQEQNSAVVRAKNSHFEEFGGVVLAFCRSVWRPGRRKSDERLR